MVAIVLVKSKYILPENMINAADEYSFAHLPIAKKEKNAIEKVVLLIYKDNM